MEECLTYALETRVEFGIWGNTSERERRQLRRARELLDRRGRKRADVA